MQTILIDTHQHLIYPRQFSYPWLDSVPPLKSDFTIEDYQELTKDAPIGGTLFMEVDVHEKDAYREALFFSEKCGDPNSGLKGIIASARPEREDFKSQLEQLPKARLKGIRRVLHVVDDSVSQSALFRENIRFLGKKALTFDLCLLPPQHPIGIELVDSCPGTEFVLDHLGNPNASDPDSFDEWRKHIIQYAQRPHVNAKISGIIASCPPGIVRLETLKPYIEVALEAFGPRRLVWGSDWPVCNLASDLKTWIGIFQDWLSVLSESEQSAIGHQNAKRIYKLKSQTPD